MKLDQSLAYGKPKARANGGARARAVDPIEFLEQLLDVARGDARTLVRDVYLKERTAASRGCYMDFDACSRRAVLDRITQQISQNLDNATSVGLDWISLSQSFQ